MPARQPALGSQAVYSPSADANRSINVDRSTCHNLTLFKELMREYRRVDDTVTMRLNRTLAQFRDRDRRLDTSARINPEEEACQYFWNDLVSNWKRRTEIVQYCVDVVNESIEDKQQTIDTEEMSAQARNNLRNAQYTEEVKKSQIRNELSVEAIIRQRSLDAFKSRCRFFEPPLTDVDARRWWDKASKGQ